MSGRTIYFLAACSLIAAPPAHADEAATVLLEPTTPWQLEYAEDRCRLSRVFGEGDRRTIFWLEQTGPSSTFQWSVAGEAIDQLRSTRGVSAAFGPGFDPFEIDAGKSRKYPKQTLRLAEFGVVLQSFGYGRFSSGNPDPVADGSKAVPRMHRLDPARGARIEYLQLSRKDRAVTLATGGFAEVFEAMNACAADLYRVWGVEPGIEDKVVNGAVFKNQGSVARMVQKNYPRAAEGRGEEAVMGLKILVGVDGRVEKCITIKKTKAENFDESACEIFKEHARFEPARDAEGNPTRDFYTTSVMYWMF